MQGLEEDRLTLLAFGGLGIAGWVVCTLLWLQLPRARRRLLPPQRVRAVPWSGLDVWFAFGVQLVVTWLVLEIVRESGFFGTFNDHDSPLNDSRASLWVSVLAMPLEILAILAELRVLRHVRLFQLGLTTRNAPQNVIAGYLGWLMLTPVVLLLFAVISQWTTPEEHVILRVVREKPEPLDWFLVNFSAILAAPLLEDLLFRGVLLAWLTRATVVGHVMVAWGAVVAASLPGLDKSYEYWLSPPVLFTLAMLPGYWFAPQILRWAFAIPPSRTMAADQFANVTRAIYGTSLLFAAFHSRVWPSPIPLFLLALGLGWLAYRTQSLVGPMVLHGLFNAVSCVALALGAQDASPSPNGKALTTASPRPVVVSISRTVPVSWLPRRT